MGAVEHGTQGCRAFGALQKTLVDESGHALERLSSRTRRRRPASRRSLLSEPGPAAGRDDGTSAAGQERAADSSRRPAHLSSAGVRAGHARPTVARRRSSFRRQQIFDGQY